MNQNVFIQTLLTASFETDTQRRNAAQHQLEQFQQSDFGAYVLELARVLHETQADIRSRRAAGLTLKNTIESTSKENRYEYAKRWLQIDGGVRGNVKALVLATLESADNDRLQSDIAQCIGYIGVTELPAKQWTDLVAHLLLLCSSQASKSCIVGSLQALSYLCYQLKAQDLDECLETGDTNKILSSVMHLLNGDDDDLRLAAIKAFKNSIEFYEKNFQVEEERNYIVQAVGKLAQSGEGQSVDVQMVACECLCMFIEHYYPFMHAYIEQMFVVTSTILNSEDEDRLKMQAVEFWTTVCETEQSIHQNNPKFFFDQAHPCQSKNYALESLQFNLIPSILQLMPPDDEDADDEAISLGKAASICIDYFANTTGSAIIPCVVPFIVEHINSSKWEMRDAAVMAFNAILAGPAEKDVVKLFVEAFPHLLKLLKDEKVLVRDDTAYACGLVYELVPSLLENTTILEPLLVAFLELLGDEASRVARCVCYSIYQIAEATGDLVEERGSNNDTNVLSPYFDNIMQKLMEVSNRPDRDQHELETAVFEALEMMITASAHDREGTVFQLVTYGFEKIKASFEDLYRHTNQATLTAYGNLQAHWGPLLSVGIKKLNDVHVDEIKGAMMHMLHNIMGTEIYKRKQIDQTEAILVLHALIDRLGSGMDPAYLSEFIMPHVYELLAYPEDKETCEGVVLVLFDVCINMNEKIQPFVADIIDICIKNMEKENLDGSLRTQFLSLFGDIGFALGPLYLQGQCSDVLFDCVIGALTNLAEPTSTRYADMDFHASLWQSCLEALVQLIGVTIPVPEYQGDHRYTEACISVKLHIQQTRLMTIQQLLSIIAHYVVVQDQEMWTDIATRIGKPAITLLGDIFQLFKEPFKNFWFGSQEHRQRLEELMKFGKNRLNGDASDSKFQKMVDKIIRACGK